MEEVKGKPGFRDAPLEDMVAVGLVEARAARLWMRSGLPGRVAVAWWREDEDVRVHVASVEIPPDPSRDATTTVQLPPDPSEGLVPSTRYRFRVTHAATGHVVGEGRFETTPAHADDTPRRFAVALMSCHQPFDETGAVRPSARQMLHAAHRCLQAHDVKFVLMVGDQLYADYPEALSLFDPDHFAAVGPPGCASILACTAEEVRAAYQRRYRHFWSLPEMQAIQAGYPCYMILDDHDIVDNWGTNPAHRVPPWSTVGEGALHAYLDYQASRVLPPGDGLPQDFHYALTYGHTAVFVMDVRTERRGGADGRLLSDRQVARLEAFLAANAERAVVLLALGVPLAHVPGRLARLGSHLPAWGEDFSDRWSSAPHRRDRDRVLALIHAHQVRHPAQRVVLLSGDIHIGCAHRIAWGEPAPALYQFVASPLTHETPRWVQFVSKLFVRLKHRLATRDRGVQGHVSLLEGTPGCAQNLYGGLNVGIVEIETPAPGAAASVRFHLYGHRGDEPVCVYRSPAV